MGRLPLLPAACLGLALAGCTPGASAPHPAPTTRDGELARAIRSAAIPVGPGPGAYSTLMESIGDARLVLLGEASHGTADFYAERARITRQLITEMGFDALAVEGDWPGADRVNRYVRGLGGDGGAREALGDFDGFPLWRWRNREVLDFVEWLGRHNRSAAPDRQAGFYGLDLQSLFPSIDALMRYLERVDPDAAPAARARFACFAPHGRDPRAYGQAVELGAAPSCRLQTMEQVRALEGSEARLVGEDRDPAAVADFQSALQNARLVRGAEEYFHSLFLPGVSASNLRDRYMLQTLERLLSRLSGEGEPARIVVWAHNGLVGNAAATHRGELGETSLGQLVRERFGSDAVLVGFTTYSGTVTAASGWGSAPERMPVRPALPESYEALFHRAGIPRFLLVFRDDPLTAGLREPRLERAIDAVYLPRSERQSHYFHARLPDQFDAVIHLDETRAVAPLGRAAAGGPPGP